VSELCWQKYREICVPLFVLSNQLADSYKIATVKVNAVSAMMRMWMLAEIINKQNDIILLKGFTRNDFYLINGYNACTNVEIHENGTAIVTRETTKLTKITRMSYGGKLHCLYIIYIFRILYFSSVRLPPGSSDVTHH
jgi:exonuclease III